MPISALYQRDHENRKVTEAMKRAEEAKAEKLWRALLERPLPERKQKNP